MLTLAQGARSVDKNCLVKVPRHEKWIWPKKFRLTGSSKELACLEVLVGRWRVDGNTQGIGRLKKKWDGVKGYGVYEKHAEILFLMKASSMNEREKNNYIPKLKTTRQQGSSPPPRKTEWDFTQYCIPLWTDRASLRKQLLFHNSAGKITFLCNLEWRLNISRGAWKDKFSLCDNLYYHPFRVNQWKIISILDRLLFYIKNIINLLPFFLFQQFSHFKMLAPCHKVKW